MCCGDTRIIDERLSQISESDLEITKPKNNLTPAEREALEALKRDTEINLKKADKGTTTVVTTKTITGLLHHPWLLRRTIKLNNLLTTSTTRTT